MWDVKPIHVLLHKRFVNFVNKNDRIENNIIEICHNLTMQGSSTSISNSVSHISCLYNIPRHNVPISKHLLQFNTLADDDCRFISLHELIIDSQKQCKLT